MGKKAGRYKLLIFKALAILLPLIILAITESVLRWSNYGHNTSLFVAYSNSRYLQVNPYASEKFFSDTVNATKGSSEIFEVNKGYRTYRIFVLGESTTIGYPYFHNGAFHRWLQFRLMQMYPGRKFEIINVAMTALNSYAVLDFGKQVMQYQPDAVMVYTGHNEYYGAMGVGSANYIGSNRFFVKAIVCIRELRIFQLMNNLFNRFKPSGKATDTRENLMKRMAAQQTIAYKSDTYYAGIRQFRNNMNELCRLYNERHIPLFLSNVVSNEKDQPPFISAGTGLLSANESYESGKLAYQKGNFELAKNYYQNAKEFDELRFRAPEAINSIIDELVKRYPAVHLVDAKKLFGENSPHRIIGKETILEHVHPNLHGYGILADAFFRSFDQQQLIKDRPLRRLTFNELESGMPITKLDSLAGEYQIALLKKGWPFNIPLPKSFDRQVDLADSLAHRVTYNDIQWKDAMSALYQRAVDKNDKSAQVRIAEAMNLEYPENEAFCGLAANLNAELGRFEMAAVYYCALNYIHPDSRYVARAIKMYLRGNSIAAALSVVPELPPAQQDKVREILMGIQADKNFLQANPGDNAAMGRLSDAYKKLGIADSLLHKEVKLRQKG
ncbi:hypothetical protein BEL04_01410 [Mucilaginibacter sp. PPCGB 2223]|uniref:SGNH/GDSL hydrolase family protein n=1 Tax=Mucilaginibacter sp. PPCGB 2223 TaxID=1886027 RepID=UPI000826E87E|nr:SGNH/GDSL hydrolase family protein [Mucilaginibacter sp. PPCGB 2223]OCX53002.1 hypothetical protein BEL04_01410 [Mucilaginibacter sp. PPCGB 2223]